MSWETRFKMMLTVSKARDKWAYCRSKWWLMKPLLSMRVCAFVQVLCFECLCESVICKRRLTYEYSHLCRQNRQLKLDKNGFNLIYSIRERIKKNYELLHEIRRTCENKHARTKQMSSKKLTSLLRKIMPHKETKNIRCNICFNETELNGSFLFLLTKLLLLS